jgi:tripartite-type tricarboxylate transporter receptor subunit TctC
MKLFRLFALPLIALCLTGGAHAQTFPSKNITIVVPYQPGGTNDIIARAVGQKMSEQMGVPVIVENKPGAGGNIGAQYVAKAAPDGYTVLIAPTGVLTTNRWLYTKLGYDAERDFTPVTLAGRVPNVLLVTNNFPAKNMEELIRYVKANPGRVNFASMGSGTTGHLNGEMFKMLADLDIKHIPYKGSAPALADMLGGHVEMMFDNLPTALPLAKSGKLRAFAVTSSDRNSALPDVPTLAEAGVKGFEATAWFGFVVPAHTPKAVVDKLNAEIVKALHDPKVKDQLTAQGLRIGANSPAEFNQFIISETAKWKKVVERSGAKAD